MDGPVRDSGRPDDGAEESLGAGERMVDDLLADAHLAAPHQVPALVERHVRALGCEDPALYLADLQQALLVPFLAAGRPHTGELLESLSVDSTLAGRAFQQLDVIDQALASGGTRVWLPLLDGTERLGVLAVTVADPDALGGADGVLRRRLRRLSSLVAELVATKSVYGDAIVSVRRTAAMGLAAEIQWSLLPPLTFSCEDVTVAGALEPAYEVAGDSLDYSVDAGRTSVAVFDGMGHGLQAAQLAVLAVSAYRNARRSGRSLVETMRHIDAAVAAATDATVFSTAVLCQLDTDTGVFRWINAGHPEPLLLRDFKIIKALHAEPELPLGLGPVAELSNDGAPTGGAPMVGEEHLQPGDRVLLYTDGVVDARSPEGEFFGTERLTDLVNRHVAGGLAAPETMRRVVRALLEHQQGQLDDDASLILVEWRSGEERKLLPRVANADEPS